MVLMGSFELIKVLNHFDCVPVFCCEDINTDFCLLWRFPDKRYIIE